jgi:hypothetical protein
MKIENLETITPEEIKNGRLLDYYIGVECLHGRGKDVWGVLRKFENIRALIGNPTTDQWRKAVETNVSGWDQRMHALENSGPVSLKYVVLSLLTTRLTGELQEALENLETDDPFVIREVVELISNLENPRNSQSLQNYLADALDAVQNTKQYEYFHKLYRDIYPAQVKE